MFVEEREDPSSVAMSTLCNFTHIHVQTIASTIPLHTILHSIYSISKLPVEDRHSIALRVVTTPTPSAQRFVQTLVQKWGILIPWPNMGT